MKCSFCGKDKSEVHKLIAASNTVAICDECIFSCMQHLVYPEDMFEVTMELDLENESEESPDVGC